MKQNPCFTSPPQVHRPCRQVFFWIPRTCVLQSHQTRRVFVCLGRNGSDGQACHVPGASWPSKSYQRLTKGPPLPPFRHQVRAKPLVFQCLLCLGYQNMVFRNGRRLWALHCCGQAIFENPGASNHHSGRSTAVVKPYSKPETLSHQITSFC